MVKSVSQKQCNILGALGTPLAQNLPKKGCGGALHTLTALTHTVQLRNLSRLRKATLTNSSLSLQKAAGNTPTGQCKLSLLLLHETAHCTPSPVIR